jgi:hypothetical protein
MMDFGMIIKYGRLVHGRETYAIDLFAESNRFFEEQKKLGVIDYFEPFFYATGDLEADLGFWVIRGEREKMLKMMEGDTYRWLLTRAQFAVDHLVVDWLTVGEGIAEQVERASKAVVELATVH